MRVPATLFLAFVLGCNTLSPLEGYAKARDDAPPFEEISKTCQEQAVFHDASGTRWTDWQRFEACMNEHGWRRGDT